MNGWIGESGRVGQRTGDKGQRRRTSDLGRRLARCLAFVLCPLSFVLALTAQAVEVNLTVGERYPKEGSYLSFSYSKGARWFKLATETASGAVSDIVQAQFADHHSTAVNLSNGVQKPTEFFFTATAPGDVTLTLYRCSDSGDLVPDMNAQYAYRGYSGMSSDKNQWMSCSDQEYTFHVTKPAEPQPVELPTASALVYNGQSQTCIDNSAKKFTLGGTYQATAVGNYTATLTPADGYYWADKSEGAKNFAWSIVRKAATITANNASKVVGAADPVFTATVTGLVDNFTPTYTVERTDTSETIGTYTLSVTGEAEQGNYAFSYKNGTFTISDAVIEYTGDVEKKTVDGEEVYIFKSNTCTLTLPADVLADILVVGGGGGGYARRSSNGGGGAGGAGVEQKNVKMPAGTYTIVVGAGGSAATYSSSSKAGGSGKESSIGGVTGFDEIKKSGGAAGSSSTATAGFNTESSITGTKTTYGKPGATASSATNGGVNTGNGGSGSKASDSGAGGSGIVVVRILKQRTQIAKPQAVTGLVFDNTKQTGVAEGTGYERSGTYEATDAGMYEATVTPDDDHCWPDLTRSALTISWTIAKRPVTVTVINTNKVVGATFDGEYNDPIWTTTVEGLIASDTTTITWDIFRTNACEEVGTYDLLIEGNETPKNYAMTFVGGTYEIKEAPPPDQEIAVPTAVAGLVYDGTPKAGVAAGEGYMLTGNTATDAGDYTATATLEKGYVWKDGTYEPKDIVWSIAAAKLTIGGVTVDPANLPTPPGPESTDASVTGVGNVIKTYDGVATNVIVSVPAGAAVKFSADDKATWTAAASFAGFVNAGTNKVWYAVEAANYLAVTNYAWVTIAPLAITVTPDAGQSKMEGEAYAITFTTNVALVAGDVFTGALTAASDEPGTQAIVIGTLAIDDGNGGRNYKLTLAEETIEVKAATFNITIEAGVGLTNVMMNGESVIGTLTLPAGTAEVELTLLSTNTIPVYKFSKDGINWAVTNKTPVIAVAEDDVLRFLSEEAKVDDPTVTPMQAKAAIIEAIDAENKDAVVPKVEAVVGEGAGQVPAKDMAKWITDNTIKSADMAESDYLVASVNFDTSAPITDEATVEFIEVSEDATTGFTFDFELKLSGEETPEELKIEEARLATYIQTTGDLGTGFDQTVNPDRVRIDTETGKVTIEPDPDKDAEFFKIVIPQDPGTTAK